VKYGCYYSFDGRRWYYCGDVEPLQAAFEHARLHATYRRAKFARVNDANDVPVWEVAV
jgi:hypothetical protein